MGRPCGQVLNSKPFSLKLSHKLRKTRRSKHKVKFSKRSKLLCKKSNDFVVIGSNINGLVSKRESLVNLINSFSPGVFQIQETKVQRKGLLKIDGYQIFEILRANSKGGSLLSGFQTVLDPIYIDGDESQEVLVIEANFGKNRCRFINVYGPQ